MNTPDAANEFLRRFHAKTILFEPVVLNRKKNDDSLAEVQITRKQVVEIIASLTIANFERGPLEEEFYGSKEMFEFGLTIKGVEFYVKLTLGRENTPPVCISFHIAEHPLTYPFK